MTSLKENKGTQCTSCTKSFVSIQKHLACSSSCSAALQFQANRMRKDKQRRKGGSGPLPKRFREKTNEGEDTPLDEQGREGATLSKSLPERTRERAHEVEDELSNEQERDAAELSMNLPLPPIPGEETTQPEQVQNIYANLFKPAQTRTSGLSSERI